MALPFLHVRTARSRTKAMEVTVDELERLTHQGNRPGAASFHNTEARIAAHFNICGGGWKLRDELEVPRWHTVSDDRIKDVLRPVVFESFYYCIGDSM